MLSVKRGDGPALAFLGFRDKASSCSLLPAERRAAAVACGAVAAAVLAVAAVTAALCWC